MKRKLAAVSVVVGLLTSFTPTANAIFGLSTCEKVKKTVLDLEANLNQRMDYLRPYEGKVLKGWPQAKYNQASTLDFPNKLWKIGYNNPECFTNTQKLFIKKLPEIGMDQIVWANVKNTFFTTGKCKDRLAQLVNTACVKSSIYTLQYAKSWPSIYSY